MTQTNRTAAPTSLASYRARARTASSAALSGPHPPIDPVGAAGPPTLDARALHAYFAAAARADHPSGDFHQMVAAVLARADRVPAADVREWNRFLGLVERHRQNPKASLNCGVLANLVGIAAFGDDADFVTLVELTSLLGVERVAAVQHRAARFVEPDPTYPITTIALRRMVAASPHPCGAPRLGGRPAARGRRRGDLPAGDSQRGGAGRGGRRRQCPRVAPPPLHDRGQPVVAVLAPARRPRAAGGPPAGGRARRAVHPGVPRAEQGAGA